MPGVVLEIVFGVIIGPQVLAIVHPGPARDFLALFGLWMLFLMAGFEMDPAVLLGRPLRNAVRGWAMTALIALGVAMLLSGAGVVRAPILTALAVSTTAIGALLPVLRDAGLLRPPYGPMVLAAGAMGEAGPVVALSLVLAGQGAPEHALIILAFAVGAIALGAAAARASTGRFYHIVERTMGTSGQLPVRLAIFVLILLVAVSAKLDIDLVLGAFVAGAVARAALHHHHHETFSARLDGLGSAFLVPIFFVASGTRLDIAALLSSPVVLMMIPVYAVLMLAARGAPALLLYRRDLSPSQRIALALHSGTQLPLVVAITSLAVQRGLMPSGQAAALVGAAILTVILFPALARSFLSEKSKHQPA